MYTKLDLGNRPTAVIRGQGGIFRLFLLSNFPRAAFTDPYKYKYMHVIPDLGEFFFFLFPFLACMIASIIPARVLPCHNVSQT